jgi:phospholipid/cholesterol/gamma-HCH transport system substrate-binding protein
VKEHIKKNSTASIGTDGLMGNKLVNISPVSEPAPSIEEGDVLHAVHSVETEEMIRTLSITNDNVLAITRDLRDFTSKINSSNGIVNILGDSSSAQNIRQAFIAFKDVAENLRQTSIDLNGLTNDLKSGKGLAGGILRDTVSANHLKNTVENLDRVSDSLNIVAKQLGIFSKSLNNPQGTLHALTNDTNVSRDVKGTISNLKQSSETLNEDLKALQRNFLFRKYFKEKAKKEKK